MKKSNLDEIQEQIWNAKKVPDEEQPSRDNSSKKKKKKLNWKSMHRHCKKPHLALSEPMHEFA